jgi:hypothetical protein
MAQHAAENVQLDEQYSLPQFEATCMSITAIWHNSKAHHAAE